MSDKTLEESVNEVKVAWRELIKSIAETKLIKWLEKNPVSIFTIVILWIAAILVLL